MISRLPAGLAVWAALAGPVFAQATAGPPLVIEEKIALPKTEGRIDHMDIDLARMHLFIAEVGNGSVDIVDLKRHKVIHRIAGLDEPQGVVYAPNADRIAVASGGDGTVRFFDGKDFSPRGAIALGEDADDARLDTRNGHAVIGYGGGGLAVIDPSVPAILARIPLPAHPEGFVLAPDGRAYVNVPAAHAIAVVDPGSAKLIANWTTPHLSANFPIAADGSGHAAAVFRSPAKIVLFDTASGRIAAASDTCGDADDIFFDVKRKRFYVSCGAGEVDTIGWQDGKLHKTGRVSTPWGARTSLFVPELDRLFVAERDGLFGSDATILVFRPAP